MQFPLGSKLAIMWHDNIQANEKTYSGIITIIRSLECIIIELVI